MISTRDLSAFPDIPTLRRRMQAMAMLDAILSADWEDRYFSFDSRWAPGEAMGSMRDGTGAHSFAWFGRAGCWMKGFDPEAPMSPFLHKPPRVATGVLAGVPSAFVGCLREPAFVLEETTFCIWRQTNDRAWLHGPVDWPANENDPDGSAALLASLDGNPETYAKWAAEYYERKLPIEAVRAIYEHQPLDRELVKSLSRRSLAELRADIIEIGYPVVR